MLTENKSPKVMIHVGMGEACISFQPNELLIASGLGSCIGLTMYDSLRKMAGMAHLVLPDCNIASGKDILPCKFVNLGVDYLLEKMIKHGAVKENIVVSIAGGSQMFNLAKNKDVLNIGLRNIIAVKAAIQEKNLRIHRQDTGGNKGRTMSIEADTGRVSIRTIGE